MIARRAIAWLVLIVATVPSARAAAQAEPELVLDISQRQVLIRSTFTGEQLLLFGAILYPGGQKPTGRFDMAVEVEGPLRSVKVREKKRVAGIWVNADSRSFRSVPGFYGVASTRPITEILDEQNAFIYQIGIGNLAFSPVGAIDSELRHFQTGLANLKLREGLYAEWPGQVEITEDVLYRARIDLPASVPVGEYKTRAYLISNGSVVASATGRISIGKTGFERFVEVAAADYGFLYGLAAVLISIGLGLGTGLFFRRFN